MITAIILSYMRHCSKSLRYGKSIWLRMNFSQNLMFSSHFGSTRGQRTWMASRGFPLNKCCPKSSENNDYHTLYFQYSGSNLTTSTGTELDDIIYLYSSPFYLCWVSFWGETCSMRSQNRFGRWCVWLFGSGFPDGFENTIVIIFNSVTEVAELWSFR